MPKRQRSFVAILLAGCALAAQAGLVNCTQPRAKVEQLVCQSAELRATDSALQAAVQAAAPAGGSADALAADQRHWQRSARARCSSASCLRRAYAARLAVLKDWNADAAPDAKAEGSYRVPHSVPLFNPETQRWEDSAAEDCLHIARVASGDLHYALELVGANGHVCGIQGRLAPVGTGGHTLVQLALPDGDAPACR